MVRATAVTDRPLAALWALIGLYRREIRSLIRRRLPIGVIDGDA